MNYNQKGGYHTSIWGKSVLGRDQQCTDCWSVEDERVSGEVQMEPGPKPLKALKTVTQHLGFIVGGGKPSEGAAHSLLNGLQGVKCESRLPLRG